MIYLGFDTSNYTTSTAVFGEHKRNSRKILQVKKGERGLRQSDALFCHIKALPTLYGELVDGIDVSKIKAVGVSVTPRNVCGSYMPVFLAGEGYAKVIAKTLGVPLYEFSHQEGHIMAGIESIKAYKLLEKPFLSVHLSGGTCEILLTEFKDNRFVCEIVGGTKDISAGQLIDRVGVKMGLNFPCGKELEEISKKADKIIALPVNVRESYINFSGIETKTMSLIEKEENEVLAKSLFLAVSKALEKALGYCIKKYNVSDVLVVGGVASNSIIKENIINSLGVNVFFSTPELSCDNAYGIAVLTKLRYEAQNSKNGGV